MSVVYQCTIRKDGLAATPTDERVLFLSLGHFANEVNALQKQLLWSSRFHDPGDVRSKAQVTLSLIYARLLAGKLKEGHKLLQTHFFPRRLEAEYRELLGEEGKAGLDFLKQYFGKKSSVAVIRNDHAFHYSPELLDAELEETPDELEMFVAEDVGNSLYYACEILASRAVLRSLGSSSGDATAVFDSMIRDILAVSRRFILFSGDFMAAFLQRHSSRLWQGVAIPIELGTLQPLLEVCVPWFTDNSQVGGVTSSTRKSFYRITV